MKLELLIIATLTMFAESARAEDTRTSQSKQSHRTNGPKVQLDALQGEGGQVSPDNILANIEKSLAQLEDRVTSRKTKLRTTDWVWEDLEKFQRTFWRAMALDPANLDNSYIPENHHPRLLNDKLRVDLAHLYKSRSVAELYNSTAEFDEYVRFCHQLLDLRDEGQFLKARLSVKKGELETRFTSLQDKMSQSTGVNLEVGMVWSEGDRTDILRALGEVKSELARATQGREPTSTLGTIEALPVKHPIFAKILLVVVVPLLFITGFIGGIVFRNKGEYRPEQRGSHPATLS